MSRSRKHSKKSSMKNRRYGITAVPTDRAEVSAESHEETEVAVNPRNERLKELFFGALFILGFVAFSAFVGVFTWSWLVSIHVENVTAIVIGAIVGIFAIPIIRSFANGS